MTDIGTIAASIQSVRTAIDITKGLKGIDASLQDAEVKIKITELLEELSEAKFQLAEAKAENLELKEQINDLEKKLSLQDEVVFKDGHYYLADPKPGKPDGPFCSKCYHGESLLIPLKKQKPPFDRYGDYSCPECGISFD